MVIDEQKLATFPAFFKVAGKKVIIIGNGDEAYAKLRLMRETSASLLLIADAPEDNLLSFIKQHCFDDSRFVWLAEKFSPIHLQHAVLVFAANGNKKQDKIIAEHARKLNIAVNVVDTPDMCDFFTPALINRAPIAVAIGSQGTSPVLTQMIRAQIEALLNPNIGKMAAFANQLRSLVNHSIVKGLTRRNFWFRFFNSTIINKLTNNNIANAEHEAFDLIHDFKSAHGELFLLNAQNLKADYLTLQSQRILLMSDGIVFDPNIDEALLTIGRRDAQRFLAPTHTQNIDERIKQLYDLKQSGKQIIRLYGSKAHMLDDIALMQKNTISFTLLPSLADIELNHTHLQQSAHFAKQAA